MNLEKFVEQYNHFQNNDMIFIVCNKEGCSNKEHLQKNSAANNIKRNGCFLCRTCSYTEDGRKKIAEATSYKRSELTRQRMSEKKKAFYETEAGKTYKKIQSRLAAEGHAKNKFENSKRQGFYPSTKNGEYVFYGSSYELLFCWQLDQNDSVESYETQIAYTIDDRGRTLDFLIRYRDKTTKAVEIKPENRLAEEKVILQLSDSRINAEKNGWIFEVVTEKELGMPYKDIRDWADEYRKKLTKIDYKKIRLNKHCEKVKQYYQECIANDKVTVFCEYCQCNHEALRLTHDKNIERNGRYICEREGGHIAGSLPKPHLWKDNPYAAEGKKQCIGPCGLIKSLEEFGLDKARRDGRANKCKKCRAEKALDKYRQKKLQSEDER